MSEIQILERLWQQYRDTNKQVLDIHGLFSANNNVINDHIALRTTDDKRINIDILAKPFIAEGYYENGDYHFEEKKLFAKHYQHSDPQKPKIFISQLLTDKISSFAKDTLTAAVDKIPLTVLTNPEKMLTSGVHWAKQSYKTYQKLLSESEYAAWLYAFGFRANHFTILINKLDQFDDIIQVNAFLKENGYRLNDSGGEVKGSKKDLLEQSSTFASIVEVNFNEGKYKIPCCYYEFAKRYKQRNGELYQGFVAASADKIFESTNIKI